MTPKWRLLALCALFHDLPWIEEPEQRTPASEAAMGAVCCSCLARDECAAYVAEHHVNAGFWAGAAREPGADVSAA